MKSRSDWNAFEFGVKIGVCGAELTTHKSDFGDSGDPNNNAELAGGLAGSALCDFLKSIVTVCVSNKLSEAWEHRRTHDDLGLGPFTLLGMGIWE